MITASCLNRDKALKGECVVFHVINIFKLLFILCIAAMITLGLMMLDAQIWGQANVSSPLLYID